MRATRPSPCERTSIGASSTATSSANGASENRKTFSVLRWKRSVVPTMIAPRIPSATMFSTVWLTSVPISTAKVSRMRPTRLARTVARAGSPRRAGRVADISTPIIVAEVTSRRRTVRPGRAARTIATHEAARANIAPIISASAIRTQVRSEPMTLWATLSTPILRAAR